MCVLDESTRLKHRDGQRHPRDIDYRHLVAALKRKPGAFARWVLRDAMFPRAVYRQTWERLAARSTRARGLQDMVGLLVLAADGHEAQLADRTGAADRARPVARPAGADRRCSRRPGGAARRERSNCPSWPAYDALLGVRA